MSCPTCRRTTRPTVRCWPSSPMPTSMATRPPTRPAPRTRPPSASVPAVHGRACSRNSNLPLRQPECRCGTPGLSALSSGATHTAVIRSAADRRAGRSSRSGTAGSTRKWCTAAAAVGAVPGARAKQAGVAAGGSGGACGGVRLGGAILAATAGQGTVRAGARRLDHGPAVSQHPEGPWPGTGRRGPRKGTHADRARADGTSAETDAGTTDPGTGRTPAPVTDGSSAPATMDWPLELPPELAGYLRASLCIPSWRDAVLVMAAAGRPAAERGAEDFGIFDTDSGSAAPRSRPCHGPDRRQVLFPAPAVPVPAVPCGALAPGPLPAPSPATGRSCSDWRRPFRTGP